MNKISIVKKGGAILKKVAKEVPLKEIKGDAIQDIIKKLKQAVLEREEAVAAAGPQIGYSLRIFVVSEYVFSPSAEKKKNEYGYLVFINPKILKRSRAQKILTEGCLSVENIYGAIKRSEKIKVEAYDENGEKFVKTGSGLFSQIIQHEMDHLDGVLFTDKALMLQKYEKPKS